MFSKLGGPHMQRKQQQWIAWAFVAAASALVVSTVSAGAWHDDFERGGLADWVIYNFDPDFERWDEKDGFVVGETLDPGFLSLLQLKPRSPAGVDTNGWNNYTVKVKMRLESKPQDNQEDDQDAAFGLMLYDRFADRVQYHFILFEYHQAQILTFLYTGNSALRDTVPFNVEQGVWYDMTASIETLEDSERVTHQVDDHPPVDGRMADSGEIQAASPSSSAMGAPRSMISSLKETLSPTEGTECQGRYLLPVSQR